VSEPAVGFHPVLVLGDAMAGLVVRVAGRILFPCCIYISCGRSSRFRGGDRLGTLPGPRAQPAGCHSFTVDVSKHQSLARKMRARRACSRASASVSLAFLKAVDDSRHHA
jgi:hypothetical protein